MKRIASCCCGQLSIEVSGDPSPGLCHCFACQRRTGSVFAALAAFDAPFQVTGEASVYERIGDRGAAFSFHFCPICGSNLFHTEKGFENRSVSVAVGCFADQDFPRPEASVYDSRRHSWVELPSGVVRYDRDPD